MPKQTSQQELEKILHILENFPNGASRAEIHAALGMQGSYRTLQHRLAFLVKQGKLVLKGRGPSSRYELPVAPSKNASIPLSTIAESIQREVTRPIPQRARLGYDRQFLDEYLPNKTYYLPETVRQKLFSLGKAPDGKRPAGTYAREIFHRLLIDLSWNSSRLEGNTYSLLETERLLQLNEKTEGKDFKEAQMILNHKEAIEFLVESAPDIGINRYTIFNLHGLLANNLLRSESCGRLRMIPVGIGKSVYEPLSVPQLVDECFEQLLQTANAIKNPFEQAFFLLVQLPYLQPFEDVNKRVSRLAANIPLTRENLCPLSFIDVPEDLYINGLLGIYELNRIELLRDVFVWAYERSCKVYSQQKQELGEPDPFRLQFREAIAQTVGEVVRGRMNKKQAALAIKRRGKELVPTTEQKRFVNTVESEVMGLHSGNIARYRLRPSEYEAWHAIWS